MENKNINIYKVSGILDKRGFDKRIDKIEVVETSKSFVGEGKRISKDKLMKIDSVIFDNHRVLRYFTYCEDGKQQEALYLLKAHIIAKVKQYKSEIDLLHAYI